MPTSRSPPWLWEMKSLFQMCIIFFRWTWFYSAKSGKFCFVGVLFYGKCLIQRLKAFWSLQGKSNFKYFSRVWFGALSIEIHGCVMAKSICDRSVFTCLHFLPLIWIFYLYLLTMQRTTEIPKTPRRKASSCWHGQINIHSSLSWENV